MINTFDKEFIKENAKNMTINEMLLHFNNIYQKEELKNYCKNNKIVYKKLTQEERLKIAKNRKDIKQRQQTHINHNYFKNWSRNMAYIFGLWCADGNIGRQNKGYQFSIKLHKNDKYLLQSILNEMQSEHKIYDKKDNSCEFIIGSKTIYHDIVKLGGKEKKSLDLKFPNVPNEYLFDFIRGYLDGDGCVHKTYNRVSFIGSFEFMNSLKEVLRCHGINSGKIHEIGRASCRERV